MSLALNKKFNVITKNTIITIVSLFLFAMALSLLVVQYKKWEVDFVTYCFFTVTFIFLLATSAIKPFSELFTLLNLFFFLGFWGKATNHILTGLDFIEGQVNATPQLLKDSFVEVSLFVWCLIFFQVAIRRWKFIRQPSVSTSNQNKYAIIIFTILTAGIAILNLRIGFLRVGLASDAHPIFPLGLLLSWFLGPGAAFILFMFLKDIYSPIGILSFAITMASICISTLSRNSLMYFCVPFFIYFIINMRQYKKGIIYSVIVFIFFSFSIMKTSQLRFDSTGKIPAPESLKDLSRQKKQMTELFMDRWIGIEGVLIGIENQADDTFKTLLMEDAKVNPNSIYKKFSKSDYPDAGRLLFYTYPGALGLLSFAKSTTLKIEFFALYILIIALTYFAFEKYLSNLSKVSASWWAASGLVQFSIFPIFNLKIYALYIALMIVVSIAFRKFKL